MNSSPLDQWESVLRDTQFDLPDDRWQAIESGLRSRIRAAESMPAPVPQRTLWDTLREILFGRPVALAGVACLGLFAVGAIWYATQAPIASAPASVAVLADWKPGQLLTADGSQTWDWQEARTQLTLEKGALTLEKIGQQQVRVRVESGVASFQVDHRAKDEQYQVAFGSCAIEVVGTHFTISVDSLQKSAFVSEGKVRFFAPNGQAHYLSAGERAQCVNPVQKGAAGAAKEANTVAVANTLAKPEVIAPISAPLSLEEQAFLALEQACLDRSASDCFTNRATFVQKYPSHPRAAALALEWGDQALAQGDSRDAVFAFGIASRSSQVELQQKALLAMSALQVRELSQGKQAAETLDALLPQLEAGSVRWQKAWAIRREAAVLLSDDSMIQKANQMLRTHATAEK